MVSKFKDNFSNFEYLLPPEERDEEASKIMMQSHMQLMKSGKMKGMMENNPEMKEKVKSHMHKMMEENPEMKGKMQSMMIEKMLKSPEDKKMFMEKMHEDKTMKEKMMSKMKEKKDGSESSKH